MRPILSDAFEHHVWATLRLIDACAPLTPTQLETPVPGAYGSVLDTMRHLVGADRSYLALLSDGRIPDIGSDDMDLARLRGVMEEDGQTWGWLLEQELDPDTIVIRHHHDGTASHASLGIRLTQAIHHGTDHRSQVCTGLTLLGFQPPAIDVWDYADDAGRLAEVPASHPASP